MRMLFKLICACAKVAIKLEGGVLRWRFFWWEVAVTSYSKEKGVFAVLQLTIVKINMLPPTRDLRLVAFVVWIATICNALPTDDLALLRRGKK